MVQKGDVMKPLIVIVGPTGIGKTQLSIQLAKRYGGEIISADAMQFYRGLDIGTAKVTDLEKENIPHHLIDILDPEESFSVAEFQSTVRKKIDDLQQRGVISILVGGSGLYIQAVLYDYCFEGEKRDNRVLSAYSNLTNVELHTLLGQINETAAQKTHPNNRKRVLRLLEMAKNDDNILPNNGKKPFYDKFIVIGLEIPRDMLYQRIEERVTRMLDSGLVEEAKKLFDRQIKGQSVMAIGYKELFPFFEGKITFPEAVDLIKKNSRRYAKRQLTWFKNQMDPAWFVPDFQNFSKTVQEIENFVDRKLKEFDVK